MSDQWYPIGGDVGPGGWTRSLDGSPVTPYGSFAAPWWRRLVAIVIDNVLLSTVTYLVGLQATSSTAVADLRGVSELVLMFCYFGYLNGVIGQTIGKRILGLRCVDANTGEAIGFRRGVVRYGVALVCMALVVPGVIDSLRPLWNAKRQSWHDIAARSIVINAH